MFTDNIYYSQHGLSVSTGDISSVGALIKALPDAYGADALSLECTMSLFKTAEDALGRSTAVRKAEWPVVTEQFVPVGVTFLDQSGLVCIVTAFAAGKTKVVKGSNSQFFLIYDTDDGGSGSRDNIELFAAGMLVEMTLNFGGCSQSREVTGEITSVTDLAGDRTIVLASKASRDPALALATPAHVAIPDLCLGEQSWND